ncbi:SDR family oxidoreductase [Chitinophaga pollutisoli]|uniref:SDR family oxidoreductase n=1 Tax=Chitinophaga pollutisoli TaxID=3133966 RepID=A0ABZ2YHB5_9BACT
MIPLGENRTSFCEKVIWITGASSGIGAALAVQLSAMGALLILTSRNESELAKVKGRCSGQVVILPAELTGGSIAALAAAALAIHGKIDMLVNNAGIGQRATAEETSEHVLRQIMELDFFAPVLLTQALLPYFRRHGGHVVVTGSMAGLMGVPRRTAYAAAKHAVMGYFESLQVEHGIAGFYITIVSPGRIRTQFSLNALRGAGEPHGQMDKAQEKGIPAAVCARKIIRAIERKQRHVVIARAEKWLWWLRKWAPALYYHASRKLGR